MLPSVVRYLRSSGYYVVEQSLQSRHLGQHGREQQDETPQAHFGKLAGGEHQSRKHVQVDRILIVGKTTAWPDTHCIRQVAAADRLRSRR